MQFNRSVAHPRALGANLMNQPRSLQNLQSYNINNLQHKPWQREKSVNLSTETFHRSRISFLSETASHRQNSDMSLNLQTTSSAPKKQRSCEFCRSQQKPSSEEGRRGKRPLMATPESLSWRRLHMSRAKLKATSTTSELLSGFAMVAMVELQINDPTNVPEWLFVTFAVCTTVLVSVHIFALMISTYILPNIDAISKLDICELVAESPHERMRNFIEIAWAFSTVLGLFLFLVEVGILCWVKFWDYSFNAAIAATVVVIPALVSFIFFAVHFYHSLVVYRCDTSEGDLMQLEEIKKNLDQQTASVHLHHHQHIV